MRPAYPHEKKVQRWAWLALGAAFGLAALQGWPHLLGLGAAAVGGIVGSVAILRRHAPTALAACLLLVLAVLPGGLPQPGLGAYAIGILFGAALLAFGECVHATIRYDRAPRAVEKDGPPEDHLDRVTGQTLATLGVRAALAAAFAGLAVLLAWTLAQVGPVQLRESVETAAPLGVAVASLSLMGGAALFILIRGSRLRKQATGTDQETAPDAQP